MQNFSSPVVTNKITAVESDSFSIQEVNEAEVIEVIKKLPNSGKAKDIYGHLFYEKI